MQLLSNLLVHTFYSFIVDIITLLILFQVKARENILTGALKILCVKKRGKGPKKYSII